MYVLTNLASSCAEIIADPNFNQECQTCADVNEQGIITTMEMGEFCLVTTAHTCKTGGVCSGKNSPNNNFYYY